MKSIPCAFASANTRPLIRGANPPSLPVLARTEARYVLRTDLPAWFESSVKFPATKSRRPTRSRSSTRPASLLLGVQSASRHLPASNRALRDMRPRRCGCWSRVCGDQGEGCDDSCRAAASVEAKCRDGDSFQYEKLAGRYRRPCGAARRTPEAYENFKRASHGTGCLTPATRHRTLAPWSQAPTAGSRRRSAGYGGRSEAEWRAPRRTSPWPAGSTGTWPWRTTPRR